ncbi:hypothetical protein A3C91_01990 [Candidatus Azambacteria bacterium RIFCSPHIGHO2_02_FULL_52_12]|uniref:HD domain-containing protein n=1 Tax=Candidatus Azambacteria bacterium RIFCSPLOWO2_01_FULL_46_25 TaxID=1797298 RepID=A0A1F5BVH7_9BACT|nr:MAG: hypothetical protein A3C91_01990 [Candidatus Azambacteria bacterium RIFCSPHIGHO2_02_FULL_52_12]OGD34609.1 MAG: hypothetical protein A2988_03850 [Candidatus Azambacteria bacterium RIFCSPLOWO2_01_FULL_46_25]OGD37497.1 MAG: hypothetical protein A2850_03290 [Candidatus Azambacteria bacterium RIFCSPHIGHO2_01_FULL_51_74]
MTFTPKIHKTISKAALLHKDQKRKHGDLPYIVHPYSVAFILSKYTKDEDIISAGLLHDTIEDCDYSAEQLKADFGERVAGIVLEVTEDVALKRGEGKVASWEERKQKYLEHLEGASQEALMVSCADKLHNLLSLMEAHELEGEALWRKFNTSVSRQMWFFKSVLAILKEKLESPIVDELEKAYGRAERLFSSK